MTSVMSKAEVERFVMLLREWSKTQRAADEPHPAPFVSFLLTYEQPLINALRFYACDKD
jgi:hypothetical protein